MQLTTRGRYAIRAVIRLALADGRRPVAVQEIASAERISPAYLEQLLIPLCAVQIVKSTRGPSGGFVLGRDPAEVSLKNILDAVGEEISLTPCTTEGAASPCPRAAGCIARKMWTDASAHIKGYFAALTLDRMLQGERHRAANAAH